MRKGNIIAKQYAGNKVDCYIYAVEKSLDSYKFNLLQNKQVFINQLKSRNLAARTIDEGAIDENGGGSFSEYVAILSGNDDLLEKAKLDKKLAVLESERQAFHRNKGNAKGKLNERTSGIEKNNAFIGRFTRDWEYFNKVAPADAKTGLRPNPLKLDGVDSDNVEILGNRLAAINRNARTEDDYMKIGPCSISASLSVPKGPVRGTCRLCRTSSWSRGWTVSNIPTTTVILPKTRNWPS